MSRISRGMAVFLEDGDLSQAERDLRAAQEALRQALERGASDEEIKKLMQDLRAALDKYMQQLAEQMRAMAAIRRRRSRRPQRPRDHTARSPAHARPPWSRWRAKARATRRAACSTRCSACWKICSRQGRSAAGSRTSRPAR